MTQPRTTQDYLALELATDFALDQGMKFPAVGLWACRNWPRFLHLADDPIAQARYLQQVEADIEDFEAYSAYATMLAGPCPEAGTDAEKIAWLERLGEAEESLRSDWEKK
jgi:hypothetical protein